MRIYPLEDKGLVYSRNKNNFHVLAQNFLWQGSEATSAKSFNTSNP